MKRFGRKGLSSLVRDVALPAALTLIPMLAAPAWALYPPDGSKPDGGGGFMNPADGMCVVGLKLDGTMLVDWSITNARDCVAWTKAGDGSIDLKSMTTQNDCTKQGTGTNDGYRHAWSTSICYDTVAQEGISRVDLDNTDAMCVSKGGTVVTTGKCVAYGWIYRNRKSDGSLPVEGVGITPTDGVQYADGLGFCYASMRMTGGTYTSTTCPSFHNTAGAKSCSGGLGPNTPCTTNGDCGGGTCESEWPACASSLNGCQTQQSYDLGLGWSFSSGNCVYAYGVTGKVNAALTKADGSSVAAATNVDATVYTNQGDCLANGLSWDNWLPNAHAVLEDNADTYTGMPAGTQIMNLDALSDVEDGGGDFYSGTGAVCLKCHSDQSRSYMERNKVGFVKTRHKMAAEAIGEPFQPFFTAANSPWGLDGVQCSMCHSTAKPAQDDLIQVVPAGVVGPPAAGAPKSASGHNQTEYGSHLIDICYTCHGTAAVPSSENPAEHIPVAGGELELTAKGLEPITNEFLNSPHGEYSGDSTKVQVGNKDNYASTFEGYVCRSPATQFRNNAAPGDNSTNCAAAGHTWYTTASFGSYCYYNATSCAAINGTWGSTFDANLYPWAAAVGGPGNLCYGIGIGSILTTVYRAGEAETIHNVDSTINPMCTNPADGSSQSGAGGFWVRDGEQSAGGNPTDTAQGNCMTCHDVHWALADDNPEAEPLRRECSTCHMNEGVSASGAGQIQLATINHIATAGTPTENWQTEPSESCETCHMPPSGGPDSSPLHLWRINTDPDYATFGANEVNLDVDGKGWVDIDHACGQCHGGGSAQDSEHMPTPPALYRSAATLATVAEGMHDSASVSYPVTFSSLVTGAMVKVDASVLCGGTCPTFTYDWNWGDSTPAGSGDPATHNYASGGKQKITLTVLLDGKVVGAVSRTVTVTLGAESAPTASATCTFDPNTWTATVTDTSVDTDGTPVQNVTVDWDDDSSRSVGGAGAELTHTYRDAGSYSLEFTAIDSALLADTVFPLVCTPPVAPAGFEISGTVYQSNDSTPVAGANVVVKQGRTRITKVVTAGDGTFSATNLRPGNYKLKVRKSGYTFATPAATMTIGPDSTANDIDAITP